MKSFSYRIVSLCLVLGGAWLFFFRIGHHSLWSDELLTASRIVHQSQWELWHPKHLDFENGYVLGCLVPYYSVTKIWCSVFSFSEAGLRSFSAFSAVVALTMILVFGPSSWRLGYRASFIAGMIFVLSPMMLWYAQEARYYAFLQPLVLMLVGCYFQYWRTGQWKWLVGWVVCSIFSLMVHPFMVFEIAVLSLYGLWQWWQREFAKKFVVIGSHVVVAGYFLVIMGLLTTTYNFLTEEDQAIYARNTDELLLWRVFGNFLCGVYEHPSEIVSSLLLIGATVILVLHVREGMKEISPMVVDCQQDKISQETLDTMGERRHFLSGGNSMLWIVASLGACALMVGVSWFRPMMIESKRYAMVFFAPFCVCLGTALARESFSRLVMLLFLGMMMLNTAMADWAYFIDPQKQNWRLAAELIQQNARKGDVWLHQDSEWAFASEYYGRGSSEIVKNVILEPGYIILGDPLPQELKEAKRIWMIQTGSIAKAYAARLQEAGFQFVIDRKLPTGSHFQTHLWLFEKSMSKKDKN